MDKAYTIGIKTSITEYYRVVAESQQEAEDLVRACSFEDSDLDFIESEPEKLETWLEWVEEVEDVE